MPNGGTENAVTEEQIPNNSKVTLKGAIFTRPGYTCLLYTSERAAVVLVDLEQRAGDAVTDRAGLTGEAAAIDVNQNIETTGGLGQGQGPVSYTHLDVYKRQGLLNLEPMRNCLRKAENMLLCGTQSKKYRLDRS